MGDESADYRVSTEEIKCISAPGYISSVEKCLIHVYRHQKITVVVVTGTENFALHWKLYKICGLLQPADYNHSKTHNHILQVGAHPFRIGYPDQPSVWFMLWFRKNF